MTLEYGKKVLDLTLQPVSGKAVPVLRGQVLRIIQAEDGGQCVDFNGFNLRDYKERMEVSINRAASGFRPKKGDIIFSNPPRYRPMYGIIEMPETCVTDILGRTCHATMFESSLGFDIHTNCQDTIAESISEYGLSPDDVHHSFNMWMYTEWTNYGMWEPHTPRPNPGRKGDYVDLLALFDTLSVPVTCGSGDVFSTSNYSFKQIQIQVYDSSPDLEKLTSKIIKRAGSFKNQRTLSEFRVKDIRTERELKPVQNFQPHFVNYPIRNEMIEVELTDEEMNAVQRLASQGFGVDASDVVRRAVMEWYRWRYSKPPKWAKIPLSWL